MMIIDNKPYIKVAGEEQIVQAALAQLVWSFHNFLEQLSDNNQKANNQKVDDFYDYHNFHFQNLIKVAKNHLQTTVFYYE
jgi:hypothetical protein